MCCVHHTTAATSTEVAARDFAEEHGVYIEVDTDSELYRKIPIAWRIQCLHHHAVFGEAVHGVLYVRAETGRISYAVLLRHSAQLIDEHMEALENAVLTHMPALKDYSPDLHILGGVSPKFAADHHTLELQYRLRVSMYRQAIESGPWPALKHLRPKPVDDWGIKKGNLSPTTLMIMLCQVPSTS